MKWLWASKAHPCCGNMVFDGYPCGLVDGEKYYWKVYWAGNDAHYKMGYENGSFYLNYLLYPVDYGYETSRGKQPFVHSLTEMYIDHLKLYAERKEI